MGRCVWDKQVTPSSWHGVTTVVMGNCGVGFAPVRPGSEDDLVQLMESVEDIPGTALHEGIPWGWEVSAITSMQLTRPMSWISVRRCHTSHCGCT